MPTRYFHRYRQDYSKVYREKQKKWNSYTNLENEELGERKHSNPIYEFFYSYRLKAEGNRQEERHTDQ